MTLHNDETSLDMANKVVKPQASPLNPLPDNVEDSENAGQNSNGTGHNSTQDVPPVQLVDLEASHRLQVQGGITGTPSTGPVVDTNRVLEWFVGRRAEKAMLSQEFASPKRR